MFKKSRYIKTAALFFVVLSFALYLIIPELPPFEKQAAMQSSLNYSSPSK